MIDSDFHLYPNRINLSISRDTQLALALQLLEEDEVQNLDKMVQMIMRDGDFATMMKQQEED